MSQARRAELRADDLIETMEICARAFREPNAPDTRAKASNEWYRALYELAKLRRSATESEGTRPLPPEGLERSQSVCTGV